MSNLLWSGVSNSITSAATSGKVVTERYRITTEYIYVDSGIVSSKEEQVPLWAVRDIDVRQSIIQKARGLFDVHIRVEANEYTGKPNLTLQNIEGGKEVRDLLNEKSRLARELRLRQEQTVNYQSATHLNSEPIPTQIAENDPIEKLSKLAELLEKGLITQDEFDIQKIKLLGM